MEMIAPLTFMMAMDEWLCSENRKQLQKVVRNKRDWSIKQLGLKRWVWQRQELRWVRWGLGLGLRSLVSWKWEGKWKSGQRIKLCMHHSTWISEALQDQPIPLLYLYLTPKGCQPTAQRVEKVTFPPSSTCHIWGLKRNRKGVTFVLQHRSLQHFWDFWHRPVNANQTTVNGPSLCASVLDDPLFREVIIRWHNTSIRKRFVHTSGR